jgi:hypothetical protein
MPFSSSGKRKRLDEEGHDTDDDVHVVHDVSDDGQDTIEADDEDGADECIGMKHPLFDEVAIIGIPKGKNVGGTKEWLCNHCKKTYKCSLTRVQVHLLGPLPSKKSQITYCVSLQNDPAKSKALREKVKEANNKGSTGGTSAPNPLVKSFGVAQRKSVDMAITNFLCANSIPFNVLRSPQFSEMVMAIRNDPKDYKGLLSEKAGTTLLDACKRNVENDLAPLKSTWYVFILKYFLLY